MDDLDFDCLVGKLKYIFPVRFTGFRRSDVSPGQDNYKVESTLGVRTPMTFF